MELKDNTPYFKLRTFMMKHGIKNKDLALCIGMNPSLFSQKLNKNKSNFTVSEVSSICKVLNISMDEYFFNPDFSKMRNSKLEVC